MNERNEKEILSNSIITSEENSDNPSEKIFNAPGLDNKNDSSYLKGFEKESEFKANPMKSILRVKEIHKKDAGRRISKKNFPSKENPINNETFKRKSINIEVIK